LTGWLDAPDGRPIGFQITFFRSRALIDSANPSAFTPRQIIFAHAALSTLPKVG
jgi:predicted secreted hydrolase